MVDIGPCMRERLLKYRHKAGCATLTPWALVEPERIPSVDSETRRELFGDAKLGLLYSGTVGYAHDLGPLIEFARECRRRGINAAFCFAGYGNQYQAQTAQLTPEDTNIRLVGFASEEELEKRLASADIHLISLRKGWEGIVVPSKFFGALAIGRPVLFSGPEDSDIGCWTRDLEVGFQLDDKTPERLQALIASPPELVRLQQHTREVYSGEFSRRAILNRWKSIVR